MGSSATPPQQDGHLDVYVKQHITSSLCVSLFGGLCFALRVASLLLACKLVGCMTALASICKKKKRYALVMVTIIVIIHAGYDLTHLADISDLRNI